MRIFDPHIHMTSRTTDDYERMHEAGVRALVEPAFWLGQPRTNVGSFTDYFDSVKQPWNDTAFSGRSDYQAFINNGVPAGGLFSGGDGTKTPEQVEMYGGTAGIHYDPNYHTEADDLTNVSRESLDIMSDAVAHTALTLAQHPEIVR